MANKGLQSMDMILETRPLNVTQSMARNQIIGLENLLTILKAKFCPRLVSNSCSTSYRFGNGENGDFSLTHKFLYCPLILWLRVGTTQCLLDHFLTLPSLIKKVIQKEQIGASSGDVGQGGGGGTFQKL